MLVAVANAIFLFETRNHLAQLEQNARVGSLAAAVLHAQRPGLHVASAGMQAGHLVVTGSVRPADPALAAKLLAELVPLEAVMRTTPYSVHGDRLQHDFGTLYVGENRMDDFTGWAHEETVRWLPTAALAARGPLVVTVNGVPGTVSADGSFRAEAPAADEAAIVVTDAAGYSTGEVREIP